MHANKPEMAKKWEEEEKSLGEEEGNPWEELEKIQLTEKMMRQVIRRVLTRSV